MRDGGQVLSVVRDVALAAVAGLGAATLIRDEFGDWRRVKKPPPPARLPAPPFGWLCRVSDYPTRVRPATEREWRMACWSVEAGQGGVFGLDRENGDLCPPAHHDGSENIEYLAAASRSYGGIEFVFVVDGPPFPAGWSGAIPTQAGSPVELDGEPVAS